MAKLYFLPMFEDVYKPYYKHNNQISKYKKTPFERVVMPVFYEGAKQILPKYEKVGDYQEYGDSRWFRKPFNAKEYYHNVVTITIDGETTNIKHMLTGFDISRGNHNIIIEMTAYNYNPREKSGNGLKGTQIAKDCAHLDLYVESGDYYIVATHKTQKGAYIYTSPYDDGTSCIKNTFFEYHSVQASIVSRSTLLASLNGKFEFTNLNISALNESIVHDKKSYQNIKNASGTQGTSENIKIDISATLNDTAVTQTSNISSKQATERQKKLSNDEYFDLLVDSITPTAKKEESIPNKKQTKPTPSIKYITDNDPKYSELYEDGTLVYKRQSEVFIPRHVNSIDKYFLWKNEYVKKVVLADNITKLIEHELRECPNLEEVVLPRNLKEFSYNCIADCPNLKNIYLDEENPYFIVIDDVLYKKINGGALNLVLYPAKKENEFFRTPSNCIVIDAFAFNRNKYLKKVDITSVNYIEINAFAFCSNLEEVKFGKGITDIKSFGFENTALTKVELPISTKIGSFAFSKECKVKKKLFFK